MSEPKLPHTANKILNALVLSPMDVLANVAEIEMVEHVSKNGQILRWAVLTTRSGHVVPGKPVIFESRAHDKPKLGSEIAVKNATDELWSLMSYALRERLAAGGQA